MNKSITATRDRKTAFWTNQKNTFGLLPGPDGTCPMATMGPGGCAHVAPGRKNPECYVFKLMAAFKGVRPVLQHNTDLLIGQTPIEQYNMLCTEFERFRDVELRRAKRVKTDPELFYRLHWSGDIFDDQYAIALAQAMQHFPDIQFWGYTRTLPIVTWLANSTQNLSLYISLDPVNFDEGLRTYFDWRTRDPQHNNVQICYMSAINDFAERYEAAYWRHQIGSTLAAGTHAEWLSPEDMLKLVPCPVDTGKLELERGCANCKRCVNGELKPIWFKL